VSHGAIEVRQNSVAIVDWQEGNGGQIHSWLEAATGQHVACFVHASDETLRIDAEAARRGRATRFFDVPTETHFKGLPLVTATDWPARLLDLGITSALVLLPDKRERLANIALAKRAGIRLISAIHPSALVMPDAVLHENVVLHARSFIGYRAEVHDGVIVNTGSQIDHHNVLEACATVDVGVIFAGNVAVRACAHVHSAVVAIPRITIGEDAIVGAGAVLIKDVPARSLVVGNPGHVVRSW
jgi:acetyltransferase-like isoleucine patch superfamily enzyme